MRANNAVTRHGTAWMRHVRHAEKMQHSRCVDKEKTNRTIKRKKKKIQGPPAGGA